jgi:hypothetical protein
MTSGSDSWCSLSPLRFGLLFRFVLFVLVASLSSALANEATSGDSRRVVLLGAKNPSSAAVAWWSSVHAQLSDLDADVVDEAHVADSLEGSARVARLLADRTGALAVVWLDAGEGVVTVFLFESKGRRLRARRVLVSGTAAAAAEEVGVVVRSAISALLEGTEVFMPEIPVPAPPRAVAPPPRAEPPSAANERVSGDDRLRLSAGYVGTLYSLEAAWQSGVATALALKPSTSPWFVEVGYAIFPPLTLETEGVRSELRRHPIELGFGLDLAVGRFRAATEALFIVDFVSRRTTQAEAPLSRSAADVRTLYAASVRLRGALPLGAGFQLYAAFGAEFLLNRFDHVVEIGNSPEPSITQLAARPRGDGGVSYAFF